MPADDRQDFCFGGLCYDIHVHEHGVGKGNTIFNVQVHM